MKRRDWQRKLFSKNYDIFISYRRSGGKDAAGHLYERLKKEGYRVFLDVEELGSGTYREPILSHIKQAKDFLLILSPNALNFNFKDDLFWEEIVCAIKNNIHIIPIILEGFQWPKKLSQPLERLLHLKSVDWDHRRFTEMIHKLTIKDEITKTRLLVSKRHLKFRSIWLFFIGTMIIVSSAYIYYRNAMPLFVLSIQNKSQFIEYSDSKCCALDYALSNKGGRAVNVTIKPEGALNLSIVSKLQGIPHRMANVTFKFTDFFTDTYFYENMDGTATVIHESNANAVGECLKTIENTLNKNDMYIQEYAFKVYFSIIFTDEFGITHHDTMEPESNYNYIFPQSEANHNYGRYISDCTLLKYRSVDRPTVIMSLVSGEHLASDVEDYVNYFINEDSLFDKDCITYEEGVLVTMFSASYFKTVDMMKIDKRFIGMHAEHKYCKKKPDKTIHNKTSIYDKEKGYSVEYENMP